MKKLLPALAACCIFVFMSGCGDVEDALDFDFDITYHHVFTIKGNGGTPSYDIFLEDHEDYRRYRDKIKNVRIDSMRYSITSNTGGGGTADLYAGSYGSSFSNATKIAQTLRFSAGETRFESDIQWTNKGFPDSLLNGGKISLWAAGSGPDVDVIVPVVIKIEVTVNPLE